MSLNSELWTLNPHQDITLPVDPEKNLAVIVKVSEIAKNGFEINLHNGNRFTATLSFCFACRFLRVEFCSNSFDLSGCFVQDVRDKSSRI